MMNLAQSLLPAAVETGDHMKIGIYVGLLVLAAAAVGVAVYFNYFKKPKK